MKKKVVSLVMIATMLMSMTACGGGTAKRDENQTDFTVVGGQSALSPGYDDNEVLNKLLEEQGINITWNTMSDSLEEQVNIQIAGGDLPDAYMGVGFSNYDLATYGDDGTFIDLTDYINADTMPNLSRILEEHPEIKAAITMEDGSIYGLPSAEQMGTAGIGKDEDYSIFSVPQFSMINKKWLDELGLEVPSTLDELHAALEAFKENDMAAKTYGAPAGSTIPMSTGFDQWCWGQNIFYAGFGFTNWINDVCNDLVLNSDGKVDFVCDNEEYRDALTYFSDWYKEGLIDQEMFSQDDTQLMAKCQQGYVGVSTWWYIEELMGDYAEDYVFLPVLTGPDGTKYEGQSNVTIRTGGGTNSGNLSVTSACGNPEALLSFYDKWYEPETVMQLQYGPIGVYFKDKDENGVWNSITEEQAKSEFGKGAGELKSYYEVAGPKLILSDYYSSTFNMEDRAVERLTDLYDYWMPQVKDTSVYPIDCVFTADELETIDTYKTDFENAVSEQEGLWIKEGGPTDEEWNAYVEKLESTCGMQELLKAYQGAYDRYKEAM
ncbi:putative aldouronate transport system substrate-binding protein [Pseudobutyrivibrio sp. ACV-2]|uniref:extracellular solute-binding protein n=1 Tax=Pseudobutyrivibrio sp. ACV-2 TaxID=1520801 RepID=UPI000899ADD8|nr:extracellular solute-binding protein [Pseudobutyrivibrio sp. ACV-2]SEA43518.1 putative aldouronate transport system substrate-binding protein [Pseudobutyrivibrio sp. ACV-2]